MSLLPRILLYLRPGKRRKQRDYGDEVLYAGWVVDQQPRLAKRRAGKQPAVHS